MAGHRRSPVDLCPRSDRGALRIRRTAPGFKFGAPWARVFERLNDMLWRCIVSLLLATHCLVSVSSDIVTRAASFHVDQFGPPGPELGFLEHLDAAAIDVAAPAAAPCKRAFRLVLMTVASSDELHAAGGQQPGSNGGGPALALIRSLSKIARQAADYVSPDPSSCSEPAAVPANGTSGSGRGVEEPSYLGSALVVVAVDAEAVSACSNAQSNTLRHRCTFRTAVARF